ncbi:hypothetical protein OG474_37715 [Kribbella sp. NBC_01505]|uniref:hypothetical protein n=1 Tax=Kribbella sp. NBC_01505 TaxID=2903580 RepID=UPI0038645316
MIATRHNLQEEGAQYGVQPAAITKLDEIIQSTIGPLLLRTFNAFWAAHNLHTAISHNFQPSRIDQDLRHAESALTT